MANRRLSVFHLEYWVGLVCGQRWQIWDRVSEEVEDPVWEHVRDRVFEQVWGQVELLDD